MTGLRAMVALLKLKIQRTQQRTSLEFKNEKSINYDQCSKSNSHHTSPIQPKTFDKDQGFKNNIK